MKTVRLVGKARVFLWMVLCWIFISLSGCLSPGIIYDDDCLRSVGYQRMIDYWGSRIVSELAQENHRVCGDCVRSGGYYTFGYAFSKDEYYYKGTKNIRKLMDVCYRDDLADEARACVEKGGYTYLDGVCIKDKQKYDQKSCERKYPDSGGYVKNKYEFYGFVTTSCYESRREYNKLLKACKAKGFDYPLGRRYCDRKTRFSDSSDDIWSD
jgi:hypothetical protein